MNKFLFLLVIVVFSCAQKKQENPSTISITSDSIYCFGKPVISLQELQQDSIKNLDYSNAKIATMLVKVDSIFSKQKLILDSIYKEKSLRLRPKNEAELNRWVADNKPKNRTYHPHSSGSYYKRGFWYNKVGMYERASIRSYVDCDWSVIHKVLLTLANHGYGTFDFVEEDTLQPAIKNISYSSEALQMIEPRLRNIATNQLHLSYAKNCFRFSTRDFYAKRSHIYEQLDDSLSISFIGEIPLEISDTVFSDPLTDISKKLRLLGSESKKVQDSSAITIILRDTLQYSQVMELLQTVRKSGFDKIRVSGLLNVKDDTYSNPYVVYRDHRLCQVTISPGTMGRQKVLSEVTYKELYDVYNKQLLTNRDITGYLGLKIATNQHGTVDSVRAIQIKRVSAFDELPSNNIENRAITQALVNCFSKEIYTDKNRVNKQFIEKFEFQNFRDVVK